MDRARTVLAIHAFCTAPHIVSTHMHPQVRDGTRCTSLRTWCRRSSAAVGSGTLPRNCLQALEGRPTAWQKPVQLNDVGSASETPAASKALVRAHLRADEAMCCAVH